MKRIKTKDIIEIIKTPNKSDYVVFLDRDGVINEEKHLLHKISDFVLIPNSAQAIKKLNQQNIPVIVISNQTVVARGLCTEKDVDEVHKKMKDELKKHGAHLEAILYCPHSPKADLPEYRKNCKWRKPGNGMVREALLKLKIKPKKIFVVGDMARDMILAKKSKALGILVKTGHGGLDQLYTSPTDLHVQDLMEASEIIINIIDNGCVKGLILAGGKGERLKPLTDNNKKEMLDIGGKPLMEHQIDRLIKGGIVEIFVSLYHLPHLVINHFKDRYPSIKLHYLQEKTPKGTAGSIKLMRKYITTDLVVLYGDIFHNIDLTRLTAFHNKKESLVTLLIRKTDHAYDSDIIETDENNLIKKVIYKPHNRKTGYSITGIMELNKKILDFLPKKSQIDFVKDIIPIAVERKKAFALKLIKGEYIKDIGTLDRYKQVNEDFRKGIIKL